MTTPMYRTICEYASLSPDLARTWWQALSKAQWSEARSWLADVRYFDQQPRSRTARLDGVLPFLRLTSPPARVLAVLEALVQEGQLPRHEASAIEECLFSCIDRGGEWFWDIQAPSGGRALPAGEVAIPLARAALVAPMRRRAYDR